MAFKLGLVSTLKALAVAAILTLTAVAIARAQVVLVPGPSAEVSVYKCYLDRTGANKCVKVAGADRPQSEVQAALRASSPTDINERGHSANCRIVGTGPGYGVVVCG